MNTLKCLHGDLFEFRDGGYTLDVDHVRFFHTGAETDFRKTALNRLLSTLETAFLLVTGSGLLAFVSACGGLAHAASLATADTLAVFRAPLSVCKIVQ